MLRLQEACMMLVFFSTAGHRGSSGHVCAVHEIKLTAPIFDGGSAYLVLAVLRCFKFVVCCRQLSTDKIVTLSLVGSAGMTFSCKKKNHELCVELPARTLQVLLYMH